MKPCSILWVCISRRVWKLDYTQRDVSCRRSMMDSTNTAFWSCCYISPNRDTFAQSIVQSSLQHGKLSQSHSHWKERRFLSWDFLNGLGEQMFARQQLEIPFFLLPAMSATVISTSRFTEAINTIIPCAFQTFFFKNIVRLVLVINSNDILRNCIGRKNWSTRTYSQLFTFGWCRFRVLVLPTSPSSVVAEAHPCLFFLGMTSKLAPKAGNSTKSLYFNWIHNFLSKITTWAAFLKRSYRYSKCSRISLDDA